jgi:hypothetical protein
MQMPDPVGLIESLEHDGSRIVIVSTGGGSAAISHLASTPGASAVVLEAVVPYAREAVDRLLGGPQETYCSSRAARRLAAGALARRLAGAGRGHLRHRKPANAAAEARRASGVRRPADAWYDDGRLARAREGGPQPRR